MNIKKSIIYILFLSVLMGNYSILFANTYSKELNVLMRKNNLSFNELSNFIDNPPLSLGNERGMATGLFYKVKNKKAVSKLISLSKDSSSSVRVATIFPLLVQNQETLACSLYKSIIKSGIMFFRQNPFYRPNTITPIVIALNINWIFYKQKITLFMKSHGLNGF